MDLRVKPNCRACFDFSKFSFVCGAERVQRPFQGVFAREVSPPRDFSQHDGFKGKRPILPFSTETTYLVCAYFVIGSLSPKENSAPPECANAHIAKKAWP